MTELLFVLFFVVLPVVFMGLVYACWKLDKLANYGSSGIGWVCGISACVVAIADVILMILLATAYLSSMETVTNLEAFYNENLSNYAYAVEYTEKVNIDASNPGLVDVAYLALGAATSERVKELRNAAVWYNSQLRINRVRNDNPLLDGFFYDVPEYLKFIVLTETDTSP